MTEEGKGVRRTVGAVLVGLSIVLGAVLLFEYARGVITNDRYFYLYFAMTVFNVIVLGAGLAVDIFRDSLDEEGSVANSFFLSKDTWLAVTPYVPLIMFSVIGVATLFFTRATGLTFFSVPNLYAAANGSLPAARVTWLDRFVLDGIMQGWVEELFSFSLVVLTSWALLGALRSFFGADASSLLLKVPARLVGVLVATVVFVNMHGSQDSNQVFQGSAWVFEASVQALNQLFGVPLSVLIHIPHNIGAHWAAGGFAIASSSLLAFAGSGVSPVGLWRWRREP